MRTRDPIDLATKALDSHDLDAFAFAPREVARATVAGALSDREGLRRVVRDRLDWNVSDVEVDLLLDALVVYLLGDRPPASSRPAGRSSGP